MGVLQIQNQSVIFNRTQAVGLTSTMRLSVNQATKGKEMNMIFMTTLVCLP
jgi:hypothetical protein